MRALLLCTLLLFACGRWEPGPYTGGSGGGNTGGHGNKPDAGSDPDAGEDEEPETCPGDPDGVDSFSELALSEIFLDGFELLNNSNVRLDTSGVWIEGAFSAQLSGTLEPGERALVSAPLSSAGELALGTSEGILQYLCWGQQPPTTLQNSAVASGAWSMSGVCAPAPRSGESLHLRGEGSSPDDWLSAPASPLGCAP